MVWLSALSDWLEILVASIFFPQTWNKCLLPTNYILYNFDKLCSADTNTLYRRTLITLSSWSAKVLFWLYCFSKLTHLGQKVSLLWWLDVLVAHQSNSCFLPSPWQWGMVTWLQFLSMECDRNNGAVSGLYSLPTNMLWFSLYHVHEDSIPGDPWEPKWKEPGPLNEAEQPAWPFWNVRERCLPLQCFLATVLLGLLDIVLT